jgi:hypothetical protein
MSIMGMADAKVLGQIKEESKTPDRSKPVGVAANIVTQLVTWIPTESITLYVAYVALFDPVTPKPGRQVCLNDFTARWLGFWIFVSVTSLLALGGYIGKRRTANPQPDFKLPLFAMIVAPLAFGSWAAALPDTPFADICGYKASFGGFAVVVSAVAIAFIAWMLGKSPDYVRKEES